MATAAAVTAAAETAADAVDVEAAAAVAADNVEPGICMVGHAVVCGFGHLGSRIAARLRERGCEVVVIDKSVDESQRRRLASEGYRVIEGDICEESVLEEAGIESAGCFIAATGDDQANLEAAITARQKNSAATVTVRLFGQTLAKRVEGAFNVHALSASFLASPAFVAAATDDSIIAMFNIDGCFLSLRHKPKASSAKHRLHGVYVAKERSDLRVVPEGGDECIFAAIQNADRHSSERKRKKRKTAGMLQDLLSHVHPMHLWRGLTDIWRHATAVTRSVLVALVAIGILSVLLFSCIGGMKPLDALYFVVTTMTTTGYGDINLQHAPAHLKIYGILMMFCGAGLMATIYAIIADYVLTARMEYMLGRRGVSLRGHTVVVGLGKVGYRVARDLWMLGGDVAAVEEREDSDKVNAARNMFNVIIGDASRSSILQKAGIDRADTLLALTDNPMLNLSVALHARESNPSIKTIVRTYDTALADKLKSFGLDAVLSTSAIAAPAFVDAALYPGVQGSFKFGDEDVLVARFTVDERSPFCGKSVREIGEELGTAVVLVSSAKHRYETASPDTMIESGRKVVVMLSREKIGHLTRGV